MTQGRLNQCMLLAIYKEMTGRLALIDIVNKFALVVISVLALSVAFAKMHFSSHKKHHWQKQKTTFFCLIFYSKKAANRKGSSIKYVRKIYQKGNISYPLICMYAYQGVKNPTF